MRLLILVLVVALAGCGGAMRPIDSEPTGATVYVNGKVAGKTPCVVEISGFWAESREIRIEKVGFCPDVRRLQRLYDSGSQYGRWPDSIFVRLVPVREQQH